MLSDSRPARVANTRPDKSTLRLRHGCLLCSGQSAYPYWAAALLRLSAARFFRRLQALPWYFNTQILWLTDIGVRPGDRVLEVGCGPGRLTHYFAARGIDMRGVDKSPSMVRMAGRFQDERRNIFDVASATALPYPSATFTHVVTASLINIVPAPEQVLREIARVTKRGGIVSFLVPSDCMNGTIAEQFIDKNGLRGFSAGAMRLWAGRAPKRSRSQIESLVAQTEELCLRSVRTYLDGMVHAAICEQMS